MPRENVEVVRQQLTVAATSRRTLEDQLVRFPRVIALLARVIWRLFLVLPARSRLRRAISRHYIRRCFEALNRQDLEVALALYHPDGESIFDRRMVSLGLEPVSRGRQARLDVQRRWNAEWGDWRFEPEQLIDLGDTRLLITGHLKASGLSSGAPVDHEGAFLIAVSAGLAIYEQVFLDHSEALAAAGLSE